MAEKNKIEDLMIELLKKEWDQRKERILIEHELKSDDAITYTLLKINHEIDDLRIDMGTKISDLTTEMKEVRDRMVTKGDVWLGLAVVALVVSLITHFT